MKRWIWVLAIGIGFTCFAQAAAPAGKEQAIFAGGCFWCEEAAFDDVPGVLQVTSGFTGGTAANPTYEQVSAGGTGHAESIEVVFDPSKIAYKKLLEIFWHNTDPLDAGGQFCDRGTQYRSAIFYVNDTQRREAEESKAVLERDPKFHGKIVTQIVAASAFYPAETYHQRYAKKNPLVYLRYRRGCGRDARLKALWGAAGGHE